MTRSSLHDLAPSAPRESLLVPIRQVIGVNSKEFTIGRDNSLQVIKIVSLANQTIFPKKHRESRSL